MLTPSPAIPLPWRKGIAAWRIGPVLYLSVPFTWLFPQARQTAQAHNGPVVAGGPAVSLMPEYLKGVAEIGTEPPVPVLPFHNPLSTFTTRGCPNSCPFCAVPRIEGEFRELEDWDPRPIVCDNNLLAASMKHIGRVVDRLKKFPATDFNQGLDARLFKPDHARLFANLQHPKLRFALDHPNMEGRVKDAVDLARAHGLKDIGIYVLIGFRDTPEDAKYRLDKVLEWGLLPNPMRYQPLDCLEKNSYVAPGWTDRELRRMTKYYFKTRFYRAIPYDEFRPEDLPLFGGAS